MEAYGIVGMVFGIMGMALGSNAMAQVKKLEKRIEEAGLLEKAAP